jgi:hypothetical protein
MSEQATGAATGQATEATTNQPADARRIPFTEIAPLMDLADMMAPMAVRVAATLRLADHITAGSTTVDELAAAADVPADTLRRLMRYLTVRGVFAEVEPDRYGLSELAQPLRDDHPAGIRRRFDLDGPVGRGDLSFVHLLDSVRTGAPSYQRMHGKTFWEHLDEDPAQVAKFATMMATNATQAGIEQHYRWEEMFSVVDVGGGNGTVICRLLGAYPQLRGTVVELPTTAEAAHKAVAEAGHADRCEIVGGSFFDPLPAEADAYLLCKVLHDWDDYASVAILRRCAEAAGQHGRVLIVEAVELPEDQAAGTEKRNSRSVTYLDLHMLVYFGGRERTLEDYRRLAATAGLTVAAVTRGGWGTAIIECIPHGGAA